MSFDPKIDRILRSWSKFSQLFRRGVSLEGRSWALCGVQTLRRLTGSLLIPQNVYHCTILTRSHEISRVWYVTQMQLGKLGLRWVRTCFNHIKWIDVEKDCIGFWFMCYKTSAITNFKMYIHIYIYIVYLGKIMMQWIMQVKLCCHYTTLFRLDKRAFASWAFSSRSAQHRHCICSSRAHLWRWWPGSLCGCLEKLRRGAFLRLHAGGWPGSSSGFHHTQPCNPPSPLMVMVLNVRCMLEALCRI